MYFTSLGARYADPVTDHEREGSPARRRTEERTERLLGPQREVTITDARAIRALAHDARQRVIEVLQSLPILYLLIILASFIRPGFFSLLGVLLLITWMTLVHVVRAEFLRARNLDYVRAARALGLGNRQIMFRHILPNAMVATLTFLPFILSTSITLLTALDFLGFGLPSTSPSIGELLNQGKNNLYAPWLALAGFAVMTTMLSLLVFIGEAARDAFDPRKAL